MVRKSARVFSGQLDFTHESFPVIPKFLTQSNSPGGNRSVASRPKALHRYLRPPIEDDLRRKMVFLGGPRQVGKTTLALTLLWARRGGGTPDI